MINRDKQSKTSRPALRFYLLTAFALLILWGVPDHALAQTQWTTAPNGTDIYNTTSGNVGIGTTPIPGYRLHIAGNNTLAGGYPLIKLQNTQAGGHSYWLYSGANNVAADFTIYNETTGLNSILIKGSNGNVGIGMTTNGPGYKLDVNGTFNATAIYQNGSPFSSSQWTTGTGNISYSSGNVGIGTTAPTRRLTVFDSDANGATLSLKTESSGLGTMDGFDLQFGSSNAFIWNRENGAMLFGTNNTERLRITDTGNVGIGIAVPTAKLDVAGQVRSSVGGFKFPDGTVQTTAATSSGGTITGVTAGAGLTGGATTGTATLNIGVGTGLSLAPDSISVNYGSIAGTAVQGNTAITVSPGSGMSGGGPITLGAGGSVTLTNADRGSSQNIFKNIANAAGTTQISAGSNDDTVRFEGSGGTSISFDAAAKKVIINSSTSGSTISAANISAGQFGQNTGGGDFSFPANLNVAGNIAAKYQDVAEWVPATRAIPAATVVVLDASKSNHVLPSAKAYDTRVAGVISAQPGLLLGEAGEGKVLVATTGRVKVKVDATRAPIRIGDLLVTGEKEGVAMRSEPLELGGASLHRPGTLLGKALEPLGQGTGEILVLLSLQ